MKKINPPIQNTNILKTIHKLGRDLEISKFQLLLEDYIVSIILASMISPFFTLLFLIIIV